MVDLALSVLFTSLLYVIFKLFAVYKVQTLYAIITNYFTAAVVGTFFLDSDLHVLDAIERPWFWGTFLLGVLFILVFNVMAKSSQVLGVSVTSVASKMSLALPVVFGVLLYQEYLSPFQIIGVFLAMAAVYFASVKPKSKSGLKNSLWLPVLVFLGSGMIDVSLNYFQKFYVIPTEIPLFSSIVFAAAGITGIVFIMIRGLKTGLKFNFKNVFWGIVLGVPNYFTIYFLLRALKSDYLNSASVFTINNVATVLFSTLLGILIFKERLSVKNWGGIALAVISIVLVAYYRE